LPRKNKKDDAKDNKRSSSKTMAVRAKRKRPCPFCIEGAMEINYKDQQRLRRFVSDRGKIIPRRNSSVCAKHQRMLCSAIKRARVLGMVPYTLE
jgi:small subunit ribosomal protein S18